jgi:YggT family protein
MVNLALYKILDLVFQVLYMLIFIRVVLSWIPHNRFNSIINLIYRVTDPMLKPFYNIIPSSIGFDISPIFAFIAISITRKLIFQLLF